MKLHDEHKHFVLGENKQWFEDEEFIIHLAEPRCFIRFQSSLAMFASYDEFYKSIAHVQWLDGAPNRSQQEQTLINAWNFLCIEERILEDEIDDIEDEIDDINY